jgi:hypothetical protein
MAVWRNEKNFFSRGGAENAEEERREFVFGPEKELRPFFFGNCDIIHIIPP